MLRFLRIRHLAIIDAVEIEFDRGLNVLTGETGAGKSILIEAVGLLLGGRASGDLVRTGEETAIVEALFENGDDEWLVRREVSVQGRSRAFVNGEMATAGALKELSSRLIELHGQHEHHTLLDPVTHLASLDLFGGVDTTAVRQAFTAWRAASEALDAAREALRHRSDRQELLAFQLSELDRTQLQPGEDEELSTARQLLSSVERIERLCDESFNELYERDDAILARLAVIWRHIDELASLDGAWQPYVDAKLSIKSQLEDLASFLRRYRDTLDVSPGRLQQVEDRLALLERLKKKFGPTLDEVIARRDRIRTELSDLSDAGTRLDRFEREQAQARQQFLTAAEALSRRRREAAAGLSSALVRELGDLAMPGTRFEVRFDGPVPESQWSAQGIDRAEFFISPNTGEDLRALSRIVSGGELSRIMLAMKTLTATARPGFSSIDGRPPSGAAPGLIFDEVDAGIGGRVADVVGQKLRTLGSAFQVLCITHNPQIAARADSHFQIEKSTNEGRTRTLVRKLDPDARVEEIGRMMGGNVVTDAIRGSARELLTRGLAGGAKGESKSKGESESRRARK